MLGRGTSTIADELERNAVRGRYDPTKAHRKARARRKYATYQGMKIVGNGELRDEVERRLYDDQSPEAVASRITRHERHLPPISKNAIYRYIASVYGRWIEYHRKHRRRRSRHRPPRTEPLQNRTSIEQRPAVIGKRGRIGDVEADFIVSGRSGHGMLLVAVDRRSRAPFLERILPVSVANVHRAFLRIRARFPELRSVTTDNDILWQRHGELSSLLGVPFYFCHPYHSWEKGTVEQTNGVIRRDVPKGSDISKYGKRYVTELEAKLNRRPLKVLGFRTPDEVLAAYRGRRKRKTPR